MVSHCPVPTRSWRRGTASPATTKGAVKEMAVTSASGTRDRAVKKKLVEVSSSSERVTWMAGRRVTKSRQPPDVGANSAKTKTRCTRLRAQMISTMGRCALRTLAPVFMTTKNPHASVMSRTPRRMRVSRGAGPAGLGKRRWSRLERV